MRGFEAKRTNQTPSSIFLKIVLTAFITNKSISKLANAMHDVIFTILSECYSIFLFELEKLIFVCIFHEANAIIYSQKMNEVTVTNPIKFIYRMTRYFCLTCLDTLILLMIDFSISTRKI